MHAQSGLIKLALTAQGLTKRSPARQCQVDLAVRRVACRMQTFAPGKDRGHHTSGGVDRARTVARNGEGLKKQKQVDTPAR